MPATLGAERPTPDYSCAQSELYAGLDITWNSQAQREADFLAYKTTYTAGLSVTRKAAIEAARALPDGAARYAESRVLRQQLDVKWETVIGKWNDLSGYIKDAWKADGAEVVKIRLNEAGKGFYNEAADKDWEKVKELLKEGKNFITTHSAKLVADGGMPAGFAAAFDTDKTAFETNYSDFMTAREDAQEQTDAKILANNAIYADGRTMMEDGKHIFRKNASVKERFTWERVLEMVTPGGSNNEVWAVDVPMGVIKEYDTTDLNTNPNTMVKVEVTGGSVQLSATAVSGPTTGPTVWTVNEADGEVIKEIEEFATLIGASDVNVFIKATTSSPGGVGLKVTFSNLG